MFLAVLASKEYKEEVVCLLLQVTQNHWCICDILVQWGRLLQTENHTMT